MTAPTAPCAAPPTAVGWRARRILRSAAVQPRDIAALTRAGRALRGYASDPAHDRLRTRQIVRRLQARGWLAETPAGFATTLSGLAALETQT